jgi:hypothetical protein
VLSLQPGRAAQRAGFRPGDLIRRFATTDVSSPENLITAVGAAKVGDRVVVIVERNGQPAELHVEFSTSDVRRSPAGMAVAEAVRPSAIDLCRPPSDEELGRGRWRPPYERLPLPVDSAEALALVRNTDSAVSIFGYVLSIVLREESVSIIF